jgi:hypothetical protein
MEKIKVLLEGLGFLHTRSDVDPETNATIDTYEAKEIDCRVKCLEETNLYFRAVFKNKLGSPVFISVRCSAEDAENTLNYLKSLMEI